MAEDTTAGADEREDARIQRFLHAYREDDDSEIVERVHSNLHLTIGDLRKLVADRAALETLRGQLLAEREAWREGSVARLEQQTGKKVTLILAPKDQCTATIDLWGMRCEKIGGHPELHYARNGRGRIEWRGAEEGGEAT